MQFNKKWKFASLLLVLCFLVFYVEVLSGLLKRRQWPEFKDSSGHTFSSPNLERDETLRILLVADPQIIGEENEPYFLSFISRFDSDNYIRKHYLTARNHVQPHIVAFLGDLFDEGNQAHDVQYRRYVKRFNDIFDLPRRSDPSDTEYIYLPGDNDVGGESEAINPIKLNWFNLTFGDFEEPFWLRKGGWNIQFLKTWSTSFSSNEAHQKFVHKITNISKERFEGYRIILSHLPYWRYSSRMFRKMVSDLKPGLVISANDHRSSFIVFDENSDDYHRTTSFQLIPNVTGQVNPPFYRINLRRATDKMALKEIIVPTCSYRMGVPEMGFGVVQMFKNGTMDYTVLWVPSRFNQLKVYLGVYLLWKLLFTPWVLWKIYWFLFNKYRGRKKAEKDNKHLV